MRRLIRSHCLAVAFLLGLAIASHATIADSTAPSERVGTLPTQSPRELCSINPIDTWTAKPVCSASSK